MILHHWYCLSIFSWPKLRFFKLAILSPLNLFIALLSVLYIISYRHFQWTVMVYSHMRGNLVCPSTPTDFGGIRIRGQVLLDPPLHDFTHLTPMRYHFIVPFDPLCHDPANNIVAGLCEYRPFVGGLSLLALHKPLILPFIFFQLLVLREHTFHLNVGLFSFQGI